MYKVIVFAGTTEGYEISRFLSGHGISVLASAATEYGARSLKENAFLTVKASRLTREEMKTLFLNETPEMVIDATHPYAKEVTQNIKSACEEAGFFYLRVLRHTGKETGAVYVESTEKAAEYLKNTTGNVLLTTGSKELSVFTAVPDYRERLYARVLSLPGVIDSCRNLGFEGRHLIAMQGPFSKEMNEATLRQYACSYLVTKDSGSAGGFEEKIEAAEACGAVTVIIGRPLKEEGLSVLECKRLLCERFHLKSASGVTLLGIGMGSRELLTIEGERAAKEADLIIGAKRMAEAVRTEGQDYLYEYRSEEILKYIEDHPEYDRVVIALSGDVGFYSGAKKLLEGLGNRARVICGISSVVYFMAKIGLSWDDAKILSAHGKTCNLVQEIRTNQKVFAILGSADGVSALADKLVEYGMEEVLLYVGENLSYPNEKIFVKKAGELTGYQGDALSVICAINDKKEDFCTTHGISDEEFLRAKVPMTKAEIRAVSLAKMNLKEDSVCYDVGAGTGSVSIEMALRVPKGHVYAIEKKEEAVRLIGGNKKKFAADQLSIIPGTAPEALENLPVPTHAFIGGSSGNLKDIVKLLMEKNPEITIVINCITLETVSEALAVLKTLPEETESEIVQVAASRAKKIASYNLMMGENPIYIITIRGKVWK